MKTLNLKQMESINGESWLIGFTCGLAVVAAVGIAVGTGGVGAGIGGVIAVNACGQAIGYELSH